jgi:hypothetical protein
MFGSSDGGRTWAPLPVPVASANPYGAGPARAGWSAPACLLRTSYPPPRGHREATTTTHLCGSRPSAPRRSLSGRCRAISEPFPPACRWRLTAPFSSYAQGSPVPAFSSSPCSARLTGGSGGRSRSPVTSTHRGPGQVVPRT